ncbi:MAG: Ig-like domain-containing protein, partial [Gemmatimonadota bacterium]|nr:Ig-like domain-containing protein [Gemmatimonadota bacterium]
MKNLRFLLAAAVASAFVALACSDDHPTTPAHVHTTATVALSQTAVTLATGEHVTLTAQPKCSCGETVPTTVVWSTSDASIATVNAGDVAGVSFGTATITAAADGKSSTTAVTVNPVGTVVGALGGVVTSADGNVVLEIPAGALATNTDVSIVAAADSEFGGDSTFLGGSGYRINPAGVTLHEQVRLRVRFDPAHLPQLVMQEQLRIRERDRTQNQWRDCTQQGVQGQAVMADISRFGLFGIVIQYAQGTLTGTAGGTVVSADGNFQLVIPPGALSTPTDIVVTKVPDSEFAGDANYVPGTGYKVEPEGTTLNKPAAMSIKYDPVNLPAGMDATQLRIQRRAQNQWQDCDHSGIQSHTVGANVTGFSTFAITGKPSGGGGGGGGGGGSASVASISVSPS